MGRSPFEGKGKARQQMVVVIVMAVESPSLSLRCNMHVKWVGSDGGGSGIIAAGGHSPRH